MRSAILVLIIFALAVSTSFAEKKEKTSKPSSGFKKEKIVKMRSGKFSRIYLQTMHKARSLDLSEEQQSELKLIRKKYFDSISAQEKTSMRLQVKFMKVLEDKEFNPSELEALNTEIQEANLKATNNFIEGMTKLNKIVGPEQFAKLYPLSKLNRSTLVQLREDSSSDPTSVERTADKQPKSKADNK